MTLNNLSNKKNIIIQGSNIVILDKDKYLEGMYRILSNNIKFEMLQFDHNKELKDLNNKEEITEVDDNHLYPCGSVLAYYMVWLRCSSQWQINVFFSTHSFRDKHTIITSNNYSIRIHFHFWRKCLLLLVHII